MPFGNHLRAHQQVDLAGMQSRQQVFQIVAAAHRVTIHAADPRAWKDLSQALLALLRSSAQVVKMLAFALRALGRDSSLESTVVALQSLTGPGDHIVTARLVMG